MLKAGISALVYIKITTGVLKSIYAEVSPQHNQIRIFGKKIMQDIEKGVSFNGILPLSISLWSLTLDFLVILFATQPLLWLGYCGLQRSKTFWLQLQMTSFWLLISVMLLLARAGNSMRKEGQSLSSLRILSDAGCIYFIGSLLMVVQLE